MKATIILCLATWGLLGCERSQVRGHYADQNSNPPSGPDTPRKHAPGKLPEKTQHRDQPGATGFGSQATDTTPGSVVTSGKGSTQPAPAEPPKK